MLITKYIRSVFPIGRALFSLHFYCVKTVDDPTKWESCQRGKPDKFSCLFTFSCFCMFKNKEGDWDEDN
ncbi:hypothetical protein CHH83_05830 [Bacillus sp. 7586-K]|nr:hypothetical protein CHH83_05830 [Bacillus sp. 7586-K]